MHCCELLLSQECGLPCLQGPLSSPTACGSTHTSLPSSPIPLLNKTWAIALWQSETSGNPHRILSIKRQKQAIPSMPGCHGFEFWSSRLAETCSCHIRVLISITGFGWGWLDLFLKGFFFHAVGPAVLFMWAGSYSSDFLTFLFLLVPLLGRSVECSSMLSLIPCVSDAIIS